MVGVGNRDAFQPPQQAGRRVAPDHNVVAGIIGGSHPGEASGQTRYVVAATRKTVDFFHVEGTGAHAGHVVVGFVFVDGGRNDHFVHFDNGFFQTQVQHYFFTRRDEYVGHRDAVVPQVADAKRLAAQGYFFEHEFALQVSYRAFGWRNVQQFDGYAQQGLFGLFVQNRAFYGLAVLCGDLNPQ